MVYLVFLAAILPALVLVYFIYRKDKYEKEPIWVLLLGFFYGALSAVTVSLISGPLQAIGFIPPEEDLSVSAQIMMAFFGAGIPEELIKFLFLFLLLHKNRYFNEYVDGIVYAVCIGMGFAAYENIQYLFAYYENWVEVGAMRAILTVPVHFFFAVTMGYFYSKARFGPISDKKRNLALAILLPIICHSLFDAILMVSHVAGVTGATIYLLFGLYIYMAGMSKARFEDHLAADKRERDSAKVENDEPSNFG